MTLASGTEAPTPQDTASQKQKDSGDARKMVSRQLVTIPLRFAKTLFVIPLLSPESMFYIKLITTWFGYIPRLTFGTHAVMRAFLPEAEAKGDEATCKQYLFLAWIFSLAAGIAGGITGAVISVHFFGGSFLLLLMLWGFLLMFNHHARQTFQSTGNFSSLARMDVAGALSGFVLSFAGVVFLGFTGYLCGLFGSVVMLAWMGRKTYMPQKVPLSFSFIKSSMFMGSHMWLNGVIVGFAKTFEVTLFAVGNIATRNFAGQYAVAMTLTQVMDQVLTSIDSVFQRRSVMMLSETEPENRDYHAIYDFVVFTFLVFVLVAGGVLAGSHLLVVLLPNYAAIPAILPPLLLGAFFFRFRVYPGVIFRLDRQLWFNTAGHVIHLAVGVTVFLVLSVRADLPMEQLAYAQAVGSGLASLFVWWALVRWKLPDARGLTAMFCLAFLGAGWIIACRLTQANLITNLAVICGGAGVLALLVRLWYPKAFQLGIQTFVTPLLKKLRRKIP